MTAWDAIVVGAGPAGSSVAAHLARAKRRVLLLERSRFPREHIGESLLPGVLPYLDALGVRDEVERAGFERKSGQTFVWGRDRTPWRIDFRELDVHPYAFFVERARFDAVLLEHARRSGATVAEGRAATRVLFEGGRAAGVVHRGPEGDDREDRARFVVDASGASALVARGAGLRRHVRGLKNLAAWSYWEGATRLPPPANEDILTVSVPDGWIWVIPLGARTSVGVVTSRASRPDREALGLPAWYDARLRACEPVWTLLRDARREDDVRAARDWSYRSRRLSGPGILLAGDAACFIDPILSTGVHLAMTAGYWAAATVHSALDEPRAEPLFRRFYDESYGAMFRELLAQVKSFYAAEGRRDSIYWASKKILRLDRFVPGDRAFLFITAGLLRNAATAAPHDPLAQARQSVGAPRLDSGDLRVDGQDGVVSPRLVWRVGRGGESRIVRMKQEGLRLRLEPVTPRGLRDRPHGSYFALEIVDAEREPLALAIVDVDAGRATLTLVPYPVRPQEPAALERLRRSLAQWLDAAGRPASTRATRCAMRRALRTPGVLPDGLGLASSRDLRGADVGEPALSVVFEARDPGAVLPRLYLTVEARVPLELTEIPLVRTRHLDLWASPARTRDGADLATVDGVAELLREACDGLWTALRGASGRADAFRRAEQALQALSPRAFRCLACGRLGDVGG